MAVQDLGTAVNITPGTVRVHLRNVYRKLNVRRQSDLVAMVLGATAVFGSCGPSLLAPAMQPEERAAASLV
jgi:3-dehydroquinate dehydratase